MTITLYNNQSDNRVINKDITEIHQLSAVLKDDTNLLDPVFIISGSENITNVNYVHANGKYYYVLDITFSQQRYYLRCHVDVLMTYKNYLLAKQCIVKRSTTSFNTYQIDSDLPQDNQNVITTLPFPNGFEGESLILTVAGGAQGGE